MENSKNYIWNKKFIQSITTFWVKNMTPASNEMLNALSLSLSLSLQRSNSIQMIIHSINYYH